MSIESSQRTSVENPRTAGTLVAAVALLMLGTCRDVSPDAIPTANTSDGASDRARPGTHEQLLIMPKFRDGKPFGVQFMRIPSDSWLESCGLRSSDVVTQVAGKPLTRPELTEELRRLLEPSARGPSTELQLERDGARTRLLCAAAAAGP
jgi:hypothetical protein